MFWKLLGFFLSSAIAGAYIFTKMFGSLYPIWVKPFLNKLMIKNWIHKAPQVLPVYNTSTPNTAQEAGFLAQDAEWELERPKKFETDYEAEDLQLYGVDDKGNCLIAKILRTSRYQAKVSILFVVGSKVYSVVVEGASKRKDEFAFGNFRLELVEPFRCWRLWYNGIMEEQTTNSDGKENLVHATLNFFWKPLDCAKDFHKDANASLLTESIGKENAFGISFTKITESLPRGYSQYGTLHGLVHFDEKETELYLYGFRTRRIFSNKLIYAGLKCTEFFGMMDVKGNAVRLLEHNGAWIEGSHLHSSQYAYQISSIEANADKFHNVCNIPKMFEVRDPKFTTRFEIWPKYRTCRIDESFSIILLELEMNGEKSHGILLHDNITHVNGIKDFFPLPPEFERSSAVEIDFVSLESTLCSEVELVGGKAASLSALSRAKDKLNNFKTAKGFCATTHQFRELVPMEKLTSIFNNDSETPLEQRCLLAQEEILKSVSTSNLALKVKDCMNEVFGTDRNVGLRFAVRSSGVLEDGAELSCAGQNETFLGVKEDEMARKIVECWASLYTKQSVTYRINHSQPVVTEMGVVVQEMVNAVSAGVLFTADPRTGNPFESLITANYGLGESVVSGACEPDSIIIKKSRRVRREDFSPADLSVGNVVVGKKAFKLLMDNVTGKVLEQKLEKGEEGALCISEEVALKLAYIGEKIQEKVGEEGRPVDIEWAIDNEGSLCILQCRAMTSLDSWTDFEVIHQFDNAIRTRIERLTRANSGEVMPQPLHAISIQSMSRNIDNGIQDRTGRAMGAPVFAQFSVGCPIYCSRVFISVYNTLYRQVDAEIDGAICAVDLTLFGRPMITPEVHQIAKERYGVNTGKAKLAGLVRSIKLVRGAAKEVERMTRKYANWTSSVTRESPVECKTQTALEVYENITRDLMVVHDTLVFHCEISEASSVTLVFAFIAISAGKKAEEWPPTMYEDAGQLLSVFTDVESAELPHDVDEFSGVIVESGLDTAFLQTKTTKEAMSTLRGNEGTNAFFGKMMKKHGHRSIGELDIGQDSWETDPTPLIALLKSIIRDRVKNGARKAAVSRTMPSDDELLEKLKTSLSPNTKRFLRFLLPYCRKMVMFREKTKSLSVKILDEMKKAYRILADLMVKERLLPDSGLLKHLTHHEMGLLIQGHPSSAALLYRAMRRLRLYPTVDQLQFPEVSVGIPVAINNEINYEVTDVIKGTPVSAGKIQGIAKVCLTVEEASEQIQQGDILITKATDIAWSPFFPMLGGVVTELGGLISHGAVVAREYGLPCVVGAVNATKVFQSGDEILLDTSTGTVCKVKQ